MDFLTALSKKLSSMNNLWKSSIIISYMYLVTTDVICLFLSFHWYTEQLTDNCHLQMYCCDMQHVIILNPNMKLLVMGGSMSNCMQYKNKSHAEALVIFVLVLKLNARLHCIMIISILHTRPTQPGHPSVGRHNEYWRWSRSPLWKKRRGLHNNWVYRRRLKGLWMGMSSRATDLVQAHILLIFWVPFYNHLTKKYFATASDSSMTWHASSFCLFCFVELSVFLSQGHI